ncbi:type II toxin-antitoxin system RelE/ParE family toxin [candidate division TA06 bacterium]|uniref:Type II toxin-antitoxin system RelE/ParE family toxin n=1 Tax=candidate division TA06 bacterium TaxID=2250710 RepID=A0A933IC51_UNCT6|nr:type II toxin-antitoxin system RelE/ParE family toxin [candidate division TA06 bacterium]
MYVMAESPAAAQVLAERMEKQLSLLSGQPLMGQTPGDANLAGMGYRFIVVKNYLVFYTVEENDVLVHRIIHGARDYLNVLQ